MATISVTTSHFRWETSAQKVGCVFSMDLFLTNAENSAPVFQVEITNRTIVAKDASGNTVKRYTLISDVPNILSEEGLGILETLDKYLYAILLSEGKEDNEALIKLRRETYQHLAAFYEIQRVYLDEVKKLAKFVRKSYGPDGLGLSDDVAKDITPAILKCGSTEEGFDTITSIITQYLKFHS